MSETETYADIYHKVDEVARKKYPGMLAAVQGQPPNSEPLTDKTRLWLWGQEYRGPFPQVFMQGPAIFEMAQSEGALPEATSALNAAIEELKKHPCGARVYELFGKGHIPEAQLLWRYPFREVAYTRGITDVEDQVRMSDRLAKLSARGEEQGVGEMSADHAEHALEMDTDPPLVPPDVDAATAIEGQEDYG